eukprot:10789613-Lingulodinium_polyedra.AAC.1
MTSSTEAVVERRRAVVAHWAARARDLSDAEQHLHHSMNPVVASIMHSKAILLFCEMLASVKFPSTNELIHHMTAGFPLAGEFPK